MGRQPIGLHASTHLPQGSDPLPLIDLNKATIVVAQNFTADDVVVATPKTVAFTVGGCAIATNDGGFSLNGTPPTSPFAGTYYSVNFGSDSHHVNIDAAGLYLVSRNWQINVMNSGTLAANQNFIQMAINNTLAGTVVMPFFSAQLSTLGVSKVLGVVISGTGFNSDKNVSDLGLVYSDGSTSYGQQLIVQHDGLEGNATNWDATITITRLGGGETVVAA